MALRTLLLSFIFFFFHLANASNPTVDQIVGEFVKTDNFSGSVLVNFEGETLLNKGYGFSVKEHQVSNNTRTKFRIGSVSKQFTAAAIVSLFEKQLLDLNDRILDYIEVPDHWRDITVHHLLTHSSGLVRDAEIIRGTQGAMLKNPEEIVESLKSSELKFSPGEGYSYSNSGYTVLVYLIMKLTGQSYPEFLKNELLDANKLRATGVDHDSLILENKAEGYVSLKKGTFKSCCWDIQNLIGAGSIYSTTEDLKNWMDRLFSNQIFSYENTKRIFTPHRKLPNGDLYYGYGWVIQKKFGSKLIWHDGLVDGFNSMVARWPEKDLTIIVLANQTHRPAKHVVHKIRNAIAKHLLGVEESLFLGQTSSKL